MRIRQDRGPAPDRRSGTERPTLASRLSVLRGYPRQVQGVAGAFELAGAGQGGFGDEVGFDQEGQPLWSELRDCSSRTHSRV